MVRLALPCLAGRGGQGRAGRVSDDRRAGGGPLRAPLFDLGTGTGTGTG